MKEELKTWNLRALVILPVVAMISSALTIEMDLLALLTVAGINFIPIFISYLFARFLLNRTRTAKAQIISVISPITISFSTSLWYAMRVFFPVETSPGIEHLAIPQMILIGAVIFGLTSIPLALYSEKKL
tara:strand:+ start:1074 stop:1463 length:390 start_codon:yes stop_codon:yes gene_type:complete